MPPCLKGAQLGHVESFRSSKEGQPCSQSGAKAVEISEVEGGKVISGNGCPNHAMFKKTQQGTAETSDEKNMKKNWRPFEASKKITPRIP